MAPFDRLSKTLSKYVEEDFQSIDITFLRKVCDNLSPDQIAHAIRSNKNERGCGVLHKVARRDHPEVARILLERLPEAEVFSLAMMVSTNGHTALHLAAWEGREAVIEILLMPLTPEHRFQLITLANNDGNTALIKAAREGRNQAITQMLSLLPIERHFDALSIKNRWLETALHNACREGHLVTFELIMYSMPAEQHEALISITNQDQQTAYDLTQIYGNRSTGAAILQVQHLRETVANLSKEFRERIQGFEENVSNLAAQQEATQRTQVEAHAQAAEQERRIAEQASQLVQQNQEYVRNRTELRGEANMLRTEITEMKKMLNTLEDDVKSLLVGRSTQPIETEDEGDEEGHN